MTDSAETLKYNIDAVCEFVKLDLPPTEYLLYPFIKDRGLSMLCAQRGIGKTYLALTMALAVSSAKDFLIFKTTGEPVRVLYIDGEMSAYDMQNRIKALAQGLGIVIDENSCPLFLFTPDRQDPQKISMMPDLTKLPDQNNIKSALVRNQIKFVILDNLSMLCNGIKENDAESFAPVQRFLLDLRRSGFSVLIIDHAGKNGDNGARGTSKKQDALDCIITLKKPDGYKQSEGAHFVVNYEKSRGITGNDVDSFTARLSEKDDGGLYWSMSGVISNKSEKIIAESARAKKLAAAGKTTREIATELGIGKTKASELVRNSMTVCPNPYTDEDERAELL